MSCHQDPLCFFKNVNLSPGEKARLRLMLRPSGRMLILPYDQFIEHDCRHLEAESDSGNPDYIINLGIKGGYTAVAIHYGLSIRYWAKYDGAIPLLLKINGKSSFPSDKAAFSSLTSFVEDAVKLGAASIGYTMYYGTPRQDEDIRQLADVRRECERFGMPLIIWAYPRGEAVDLKGGRDSNYALESAARMAAEMGATVIKSNEPKPAPEGFLDNEKVPKYFRKVEKELQAMKPEEAQFERMKRVVKAAQDVPVLFSGGSEIGDDDLLKKAKQAIDAGSIGFIFGRNMWKRKEAEALKITKKLTELLDAEVKR